MKKDTGMKKDTASLIRALHEEQDALRRRVRRKIAACERHA